jgi:hypothetical protein
MTTFVLAFASLAVVLGIYAFVGLPFGGRGRRILVSAFFALLIAGLFFGYSDMLGRPKSTRLELLRSGDQEAKAIGSYMIEGSGIYLSLAVAAGRRRAALLHAAVGSEDRQRAAEGDRRQFPIAWRRRCHADPLLAVLGQARPGLPSAAAAEAAGKRRPAAAGDHLHGAGAARVEHDHLACPSRICARSAQKGEI